jgi:endonuclease YncB( thermonuclease family)
MPSLPVKYRRWIIPLTLTVIALASAADRLGAFGHQGDDLRRFDRKSFPVARVVDGDTFEIALPSPPGTVRIRLLGVAAPKLTEHWSSQSAQALSDRLTGHAALLRLDPMQTRDRLGEIEAYVYLDDELINVEPIRLGQAYADRRVAHAWESVFESTEASTRRRKIGLWEALRSSQMPQWRREWLRSFSSNRPR